jgi:hypothetical protein
MFTERKRKIYQRLVVNRRRTRAGYQRKLDREWNQRKKQVAANRSYAYASKSRGGGRRGSAPLHFARTIVKIPYSMLCTVGGVPSAYGEIAGFSGVSEMFNPGGSTSNASPAKRPCFPPP